SPTGTSSPNGSSKPTPTSSSTSSNSSNQVTAGLRFAARNANHLVLDAAGVYPVRRDEHLQEMGIQLFGHARSEPAKAGQLRGPFQVDPPVGARVALRREH